MTVRSTLRQVPGLLPLYRLLKRSRTRLVDAAAARVTLERLPPSVATRLIYETMLGKHLSPEAARQRADEMAAGDLSRQDFAHMLRGTEDFFTGARYRGPLLGYSIHSGRCQFIQLLPKARRILDLGGTHQHNEVGALVALGYPYPFEELIVVDLPGPERHAIYQAQDDLDEVMTPLGPVKYRYHSMADLSAYPDRYFDLVYSGQSFEHVTQDEGRRVLQEVRRVLVPGGHLALDTPNARVTRLQQEQFIDPDHKLEYELPELVQMIDEAGFTDVVTMGLNLAQDSLARGRFQMDAVAQKPGLFAEAADCYILCLLCTSPG